MNDWNTFSIVAALTMIVLYGMSLGMVNDASLMAFIAVVAGGGGYKIGNAKK